MTVAAESTSIGGMDEPTDDLFLDAVQTMVLHVLDRIGDDPQARCEFYRLLAVAREVAATGRSLA